MAGVLLIDKPAGPTSHDVVALVRRVLREKRCGHTGTLDPFATGLLMLCLGRATRLARFFSGADKTYVATLHFGYATDTYDRTGTPQGDVRDHHPDPEALAQLLQGFVGRQLQRPPAFSAKKIGGKRLYQLAREGTPVEARPVEVDIRALELLKVDGARADIEVTVSSGTYIRSLAYDVGEKLGCGAHLSELRRIRVGSFSVSDAVDVATLESDGAATSMLSPHEALRELPRVQVGVEAAQRLVHGQAPRWDELIAPDVAAGFAGFVRVVGPTDELLAVGTPELKRGVVRPVVVWASGA
jgi:tRNA pseudouridine55 synthase